jgi:hypothetical protein
MSTVNELFRQICGDTIADNVKVKGLKIVVEVNDPAWASQLKFLENRLCQTIENATDAPIKGLEIIVRREK